MPVINGVYTKDFPALGRAPIDTDIIPIAEVANQITYKTTLGEIFNAKVFGTTGRLSKFSSANTLGNSILNEIGNAIHLTNAGTSFASFGIINPGTPGEPGIDNDAYIGSTINNDFTIRVNNVEAARFDTALRFKIANIQNADTDTDKFLVSDGGVVKYRTGTELRADIGAGVGSVTSVGLTMPVAFSVANSPITSAGTLAVTAVGTASQYIRGDGQLATLPTGAGGGSAVNYYLNGSVASSVAGYQQMDNTAIIGAGTDFNLTGNGLIAQFLTDAGNPNRLQIPGGAWNLEMFFSVSSSGGNAKFYAEVLEYDGTTFTSIASGITTPEEITGGTSIDLYLTSLGVPETALLITDRLAIRVYIVDNSGGRTVTLHTEDNNLCQIITTFAGGISALNGLTANTQYFAVGTSGSDFNISSLTDTHTFNLPDAGASARGLITTGVQTIAGPKIFNNDIRVNTINIGLGGGAVITNTRVGVSALSANTSGDFNTANGYYALLNNTSGNSNTANGTISIANNTTGSFNTAYGSSSGGINTTGSNNIFLGYNSNGQSATESNRTWIGNTDTTSTWLGGNLLLGSRTNSTSDKLQVTGSAKITGIITLGSTITNGTYTYTLPSATGTLALTSDLSAYVTLATTQTITGAKTFSLDTIINGVNIGRGGGAISSNTRIGSSALNANTTGTGNTASGINALNANTTGNNNTSNGNNSLVNNTTGSQNSAYGYLSLSSNTTSSANTANGVSSLTNTTGNNNTAFGASAGSANTTGVNNTFFGYNSQGESPTESNRTWIGNTDTTSTWLGGNLLLGSRTNSTSDKLQVTGSAKITGIITLGSTITNGTYTYTLPSANGTLALTSNITSAISGTTNYIPKFTGANTIGNSQIQDDGTNTSIGYTTNPSLYKLDVNGTGRFSGTSSLLYLNNTTPTTGKVWRFSSASDGNFYITQESVVDALKLNNTTGAATFSSSVGVNGATSNYSKLDIAGSGGSLSTVSSIQFYDNNSGSSRNFAWSNGAGGNTTDLIGKFVLSASSTVNGNALTGNALMTVTSGGNVGIGTTTPTNKLSILNTGSSALAFKITDTGANGSYIALNAVNGGAEIVADGNTGIPLDFYTGGNPRMRITSGGTIFMYNLGGYASANADVRYDTSSKELYYQTSSLRYKTNITNLENSLEKINKLRTVRYQDKTRLINNCGLIAEEVYEIIPDVVFKKQIDEFDEPQIEGINYSDFIPFLIKAIQEQQAQIEELKLLIQNK